MARRIGTYSSVRASLLARLSSSDYPALGRLTTRESGDFTVGLLESVAVVADILTFYQERIANESYLRTATDPASLARIGELVGYRLRPGVAAQGEVAFEVEDAEGGPATTQIPAGTRAQSIPGPGERPQVFETGDAIEARPEWNAIRPRLAQPQVVSTSMTRVLVKGIATGLRPGDRLLIVGGPPDHDRAVKRILGVTPDPGARFTAVDLDLEPPPPHPFPVPPLPAGTFLTEATPLTSTVVSTRIVNASWKQSDLTAMASVQSWPQAAIAASVVAGQATAITDGDEGVYLFQTRAPVFGHNAPKYEAVPADARPGESNWDSPPLTLAAEAPSVPFVHLDATYPGIVPGGWVVLESPLDRRVYRVDDCDEISRTAFTLGARVSRVRLDSSAGFNTFTLRSTTVLAQSERLPLADLPIDDPVTGASIMLDGIYLGLESGRTVIVSGERIDLPGVAESEVHEIADVILAGGYTVVTLARALAFAYTRATVAVAANVAFITNGESVDEVLGGGDASKPFQEFALRQPPLTWVGADVPGGARAALEVWVDGVRWERVDTFFGRRSDERIYLLAADDTGVTTVRFGDGRTGARVPTGSDNVRAVYRKGIGRDGQVAPAQIAVLLTRPVGVRAVTNPMATRGAADPESADDARRTVPLGVLALDRIVSLGDYEDFARAFAGVAKALATWTWDRRRQAVLLTVAGRDGAALLPGDAVVDRLVAAVQRAADPIVPVHVVPHRPAFFRVAGTINVDPDRQPPAVLAAIEAAMRAAFGFVARGFGQGVSLSDVIAVMQGTAGVTAVNVTALHRTDAPVARQSWLQAAGPVATAGDGLLGAELLLLDPRPLDLGVMA